MHGYGIQSYDSGRKYEGMYVDDIKQGHGIYTWASGKHYDGQWKDDVQHGFGMIFKPKKGKRSYGFW
jgi:hypothetical protein